MSRVLILSSWVAHGHVGLSAAVPVLQLLGHQVTQLPTTVLSNHPGWPHVAGAAVPVAQLAGMVEALAANGWLDAQDAVLTGYLPTSEHVAFAVDLLGRMRGLDRPPRVIVDPVLGDAPKGLYVPEPVAEALRDQLVPLADVLTPNAFELEWLTGLPTGTLADCRAAARQMRKAEVLVTSAPAPGAQIGVLQVGARSTQLWAAPLHTGVPHGVGDVFSALIAGGLNVATALGHLHALIDASLDAAHLRIAETAPDWTRARPLPPTDLPET